jgi:hypothetical protein
MKRASILLSIINAPSVRTLGKPGERPADAPRSGGGSYLLGFGAIAVLLYAVVSHP